MSDEEMRAGKKIYQSTTSELDKVCGEKTKLGYMLFVGDENNGGMAVSCGGNCSVEMQARFIQTMLADPVLREARLIAAIELLKDRGTEGQQQEPEVAGHA